MSVFLEVPTELVFYPPRPTLVPAGPSPLLSRGHLNKSKSRKGCCISLHGGQFASVTQISDILLLYNPLRYGVPVSRNTGTVWT